MKLTKLSSIEDFAQYLHDAYPGNDYTEHEGTVFRNVKIAYQICSRVLNRDERARLSKLPDDEIRQKLEHHYPSLRPEAFVIMEKILLNKICGCKQLRNEFLSNDISAYGGEFGKHLQAIYNEVKKKAGLR